MILRSVASPTGSDVTAIAGTLVRLAVLAMFEKVTSLIRRLHHPNARSLLRIEMANRLPVGVTEETIRLSQIWDSNRRD